MRKLSELEVTDLGASITHKEFWDSLLEMNSGKSHSLDVSPVEDYIQFWPELGPMLLETINT